MTSRRNERLESQIEASKQGKRRRVDVDLNSTFADIEAIRNSQIEAGAISPDSDDSEDSSTPTEEGSVIVVGGS